MYEDKINQDSKDKLGVYSLGKIITEYREKHKSNNIRLLKLTNQSKSGENRQKLGKFGQSMKI